MRKYICLLLALLLLVLSGCSAGVEVLTNDKYAILEKDGIYSMKLHDPEAYSGGGSASQNASEAFYVEFSSVGKMKETIEEGSFSKETLEKMQECFSKDQNNNVLICNTNKLYDVTLPQGVTARAIHWFGDSYNFLLGDHGAIDFTNKAWHDEYAKRHDIESGKAKVISVNMLDDRNAKEVIYENLLGQPRSMITYSYTSGNKTISVAEQYNLDESETIPYSIGFWGCCNGAYFTGHMYGLTERPSYEWVTAFGLKPYVETETE